MKKKHVTRVGLSNHDRVKVLYLPQNIASMPSITSQAIGQYNCEARYLTKSEHHYQSHSNEGVVIPNDVPKRSPLKWVIHQLSVRKNIRSLIKWADVVHYTWGPFFKNAVDLDWVYKNDKPVFIEWVGSDIRNPEIIKKINPFYEIALRNGYEYADLESQENSLRNQQLFAKAGAIPVLCPEMSLYLDKSLFRESYILFQRINTRDFITSYPEINKARPLIVHSPSAKVAKGSDYILETVEKLKRKFSFEFKLLHNLPRKVVLEELRSADIFIDQIIIGGYGMAAMEAMSFGKPVVAYLMPEVFNAGLPASCPIVNTNPENLEMNLAKLITDAASRHTIGVKSREYVEQYHNADTIAEQLIGIYQKAISEHDSREN